MIQDNGQSRSDYLWNTTPEERRKDQVRKYKRLILETQGFEKLKERDFDKVGFGEGASTMFTGEDKPWYGYLPVGSAIAQIESSKELVDASDRLKELTDQGGSFLDLDEADQDRILDYSLYQAREHGMAANVGSIVGESVSFMGEMALTGGVSGAARAGVGLAAKRTLKEVLAETTERKLTQHLAKRVAGRGLETIVQTGAMEVAGAATRAVTSGGENWAGGRVYANAWQRALPELNLSEDESGELDIVVTRAATNAADHLPKAIVDTLIEVGSEGTGRAIDQVGGLASTAFAKYAKRTGLADLPAAQRIKAFTAAMAKWDSDRSGNTFKSSLLGFKDRAQFQSTFGEMMEEVVGATAREGAMLVTGWDDLGGWENLDEASEWGAMAIGFGLTNAGFAVTGKLGDTIETAMAPPTAGQQLEAELDKRLGGWKPHPPEGTGFQPTLVTQADDRTAFEVIMGRPAETDAEVEAFVAREWDKSQTAPDVAPELGLEAAPTDIDAEAREILSQTPIGQASLDAVDNPKPGVDNPDRAKREEAANRQVVKTLEMPGESLDLDELDDTQRANVETVVAETARTEGVEVRPVKPKTLWQRLTQNIAERRGQTVVWAERSDGQPMSRPARYDRNSNTVLMDLRSSLITSGGKALGPKAAYPLAAHETAHSMNKEAPGVWQILKDIIEQKYGRERLEAAGKQWADTMRGALKDNPEQLALLEEQLADTGIVADEELANLSEEAAHFMLLMEAEGGEQLFTLETMRQALQNRRGTDMNPVGLLGQLKDYLMRGLQKVGVAKNYQTNWDKAFTKIQDRVSELAPGLEAEQIGRMDRESVELAELIRTAMNYMVTGTEKPPTATIEGAVTPEEPEADPQPMFPEDELQTEQAQDAAERAQVDQERAEMDAVRPRAQVDQPPTVEQVEQVEPPITEPDYTTAHRPDPEGPRAHDLLEVEMLPDDVYDRMDLYGGNQESHDALRAARGKPDATVTIYRSAPPEVTEINPGDWVSLSEEYARQHGMDAEDATKDWPVISMEVPASDVRFAGDDLNEFGYFPKPAPEAAPAFVEDVRLPEQTSTDEYGRPHYDWRGAQVFHYTPDDASVQSITEDGYKMVGGGYYGDAISFTNDEGYAQSFGGKRTVAQLADDIVVVEAGDPRFDKLTSGSSQTTGERARAMGVDALYDFGAGDLFVFNSAKVSPALDPEAAPAAEEAAAPEIDWTQVSIKDFKRAPDFAETGNYEYGGYVIYRDKEDGSWQAGEGSRAADVVQRGVAGRPFPLGYTKAEAVERLAELILGQEAAAPEPTVRQPKGARRVSQQTEEAARPRLQESQRLYESLDDLTPQDAPVLYGLIVDESWLDPDMTEQELQEAALFEASAYGIEASTFEELEGKLRQAKWDWDSVDAIKSLGLDEVVATEIDQALLTSDVLHVRPLNKEKHGDLIEKWHDKHHKRDKLNPRYEHALAVVQRGKVVAVATIGTPTGRWSGDKKGNLLELQRVVSSGKAMGASSTAAASAIEYAEQQGKTLITYSETGEAGSTYKELMGRKKKGKDAYRLRPTAVRPARASKTEQTRVREAAKRGEKVKAAKDEAPKILWMAGPHADEMLDDWESKAAEAQRKFEGVSERDLISTLRTKGGRLNPEYFPALFAEYTQQGGKRDDVPDERRQGGLFAPRGQGAAPDAVLEMLREDPDWSDLANSMDEQDLESRLIDNWQGRRDFPGGAADSMAAEMEQAAVAAEAAQWEGAVSPAQEAFEGVLSTILEGHARGDTMSSDLTDRDAGQSLSLLERAILDADPADLTPEQAQMREQLIAEHGDIDPVAEFRFAAPAFGGPPAGLPAPRGMAARPYNYEVSLTAAENRWFAADFADEQQAETASRSEFAATGERGPNYYRDQGVDYSDGVVRFKTYRQLHEFVDTHVVRHEPESLRAQGLPDRLPPSFYSGTFGQKATRITDTRFAAPATPEFRKLLKGTTVVNAKGDPLQVYHGSTTAQPFATFRTPAYFSNKKSWATAFGSANVYSAYLRIVNPYVIDGTESGRHFEWDAEQVQEFTADGHDGVIVRHPKGDVYTVFEPTQVIASQADTRFAAPSRIEMGHKDVTKRVEQLTLMAQALRAGYATREQFQEVVNQYKPVRAYEEIPTPATQNEIVNALTKPKKGKAGPNGPIKNLKQGENVELRLDIPSYKDHGVWVPTIHAATKAKTKAGKVIGYDSVASVTDAAFKMSDTAALNIAAGSGKSPFAVIQGKWQPMTPGAAVARAQEVLLDPEWSQVGMDPERHGYFWDRVTQEPVVAAAEVIQIGPLVLAKNAEFGDRADFRFAAQAPLGSGVDMLNGEERLNVIGTGKPTKKFPEGKPKVVDLGKALDERQARLGVTSRPGDYSDENLERLAEIMVSEVLNEVGKNTKMGSAANWYGEKIEQAVQELLREFPELRTDAAARAVFMSMLAVTSNGTAVEQNMKNAVEVYAHWKKKGRVPRKKYSGARAKEIAQMLINIEAYLQQHGAEQFQRDLMETKTVAEWRKDLRMTQENLDALDGYAVNDVLRYSQFWFGPKLGTFYLNLQGIQDVMTVDLWFSRMWNRWTGNVAVKITKQDIADAQSRLKAAIRARKGKLGRGFLKGAVLSDDAELERFAREIAKAAGKDIDGRKGKDLVEEEFGKEIRLASNRLKGKLDGGLHDAPRTGAERRFMTQTARRAIEILAQRDHPMELSTLQAILWYPEKRLYSDYDIGSVKSDPMDYAQAAKIVMDARSAPQAGAAGRGRGSRAASRRRASSEAARTRDAAPDQRDARTPRYEAPQLTTGVEEVTQGVADAPTGKVRGWLRRNLTTRGHIPESAFRAKLARDGALRAIELEASMLQKDLAQAIKRLYKRKPTDEELQAIDTALKSKDGYKLLPQSLQAPVQAMREHLDVLSNLLINSGAVQGDMIATIQKNLGTYLTRSYQAFDDPKWKDRVDPEVINRAVAFLREQYKKQGKPKTEEELLGKVKALLNKADSPMAVLASKGSKGISKDLSLFKRRKDIAPELRELWGEYTDPMVNYTRSVSKMANVIANHALLEQIKESGTQEGWLFDKEIANERGEFTKPMAGPNSVAMAPLDGTFSTPEIVQGFEDAMERANHGDFFRWYMKINGSVKYAKTVLSLMTNVRNLVGNVGFAVANGHWDFTNMKTAGQATWSKLRTGGAFDNAQMREYLLDLTRRGVIGDGARAGELRQVIDDAIDGGFEAAYDKGLKKVGKKILSVTTSVYSAEDDVWKIYAFESEVARYVKAGFSEAEAKDRAAAIVRNTYPTYSMIPRLVKTLRVSPAVGAFVSFPAEVLRTGFHTIAIAKQELSDPRTRRIGAQRAAGIIAASSMTTAASIASKALFGFTDDDEEAVRQFAYPWQKQSEFLFLGKDDDGNVRFIDMSYSDPHSYLKKPIRALLTGEDPIAALVEATGSILEPFASEEILSSTIIDIVRNRKKDSNTAVYNEEAPIDDQVVAIMAHLWPAFEPGTISSGRRIAKAITGEKLPGGRTYDTTDEIFAVLSGQRMQTIDVKQGLGWKVRDFNRSYRQATSLITNTLRDTGTITQEDLEDAYRDANEAHKRTWDKMREISLHAMRLGVPRGAVRSQLVSEGMSKAKADNLLRNKYEVWSISSVQEDNILKLATNSQERRDFKRRIRQARRFRMSLVKELRSSQ